MFGKFCLSRVRKVIWHGTVRHVLGRLANSKHTACSFLEICSRHSDSSQSTGTYLFLCVSMKSVTMIRPYHW